MTEMRWREMELIRLAEEKENIEHYRVLSSSSMHVVAVSR